MAQSEAQIGYGTLLKIGNDASPQVFTTIAEVKSISGFGFTANEVDVTHMESPGGYTERIAGMKDGDTLTVLLNMTRSQSLSLKARWEAGLVIDFELNFPGTLPDHDFSAAPLGWHLLGITPASVLEVEVTMRISGSITGS
jgi:hypothetical protein